jgi:hypothetical protein
METPDQQPDQPTPEEGTSEDPTAAGGETPTPASLPSDSESEGDAREGDDEHEGDDETDEESAGE